MATSSKLAVIVHIDVAGSTALVQKDEGVAHDRIQEAFRSSSDIISKYNGTIHELRGDALIAEFERASDALSAGLALQAVNDERNTALDDAILPRLRLGISLGEVVIAHDTLTGPGVVLAQRVEQLSEPGGITVTEAIREAVPDRMPFEYEDRGMQRVKGFDNPVHVYAVRLRAAAEIPSPAETARRVIPAMPVTRTTQVWVVATSILILTVASLIAWMQPWRTASIGPAQLEIPERPSIAVLPFTNVSNDVEQEYFADGLTDDLITDLSKLSGLFVVSRNSVFSFKKQAIRAEEVAQALGVRFVLEGTVRRASDRVRVNAQLVNGNTGRHVWAERYDREITDIFGVQDELVTEIVKALAVELTPEEQTQVERVPTRNLQAYDHYLRARDIYFSGIQTEQREGVELYRLATELDPEFAEAYAGLARLTVDVWRFDYLVVMNPVLARKIAEESATRALELDPSIPQAHSVLALLRMVDGQHEFAAQLAQRAVELAPNSADAHTALAVVLGYGGAWEQALDTIRMAVRLNPRPPVYMQSTYGWVLFMNRQYDSAIAVLEPITDDRDPAFGDSPGETLAMAYARAGLLEKAKSRREILLFNYPYVNLAYYRLLYSHHKRRGDLDHRVQALREAGVPEHGLGHEGDPAARVSGDALRQLVAAGRTWQGKDAARDGQPFVQEFMEQGNIVYATQSTMMTGSVTVREGQVCKRFEILTFGRYGCGYVYRNAEGTAETQDEYVFVGPTSMLYFSPVR